MLHGDVPGTLARLQGGLLIHGQGIPFILPLANDSWPIDLSKAIYVRAIYTKLRHLCKDRCGRRRCRCHHLYLLRPVLGTLVLQHRAHDDRCAAQVCHLVLRDGAEDIVCDYLAQANVSPHDGGDGVVEEPAIAVEHWQCPQVDGMAGHGPCDNIVHAVQIAATVVEEHALGVSRGATCVTQRERIPLILRGAPGCFRVALGEELLVVQCTNQWAPLLAKGIVDIHNQGSRGGRHGSEGLRHELTKLPVHNKDLCS
mmetsp:Transcript_78540/g.168299  ORF Transcript_78540/g.168299 Transcript_78540/m.168299 type:complete len:256 (+) Transcript_78540:644-1411(+)